MLMSDKKKPATLIVAKMKEGKESMEQAPQSEMGAESDDSMAKESAAEELLAAIEAKDAKALASAWDAMMELCGGESEEE